MGTTPGIQQVRTGSQKPKSKQAMVKVVFLGITQKGELATLTQVTSLSDYVDKFGAAITSGWIYQAVEMFFKKGGYGELWVGRVVHYTDPATPSTKTSVAASLTLKDRSGGAGLDTLKVEAITDGDWGERIKTQVADATLDAANKFKIIVTYDDVTVETWDELSMSDVSANFCETLINGNSSYIKVTDLDVATVAPNDRPLVLAATALASGDDGLTGLVDADWLGSSVGKTGFYMCQGITTRYYLALPGITSRAVIKGGFAFADVVDNCFFVAELPTGLTDAKRADFRNALGDYVGLGAITSYNGAMYTPWIKALNAATLTIDNVPPSPAILAAYTDVEFRRGIWKAPAGITDGNISFANGVEAVVDPSVFYDYGVNAIKSFTDYGVCIWGSRTPSSDADWVDVVVPLMFLYIEDWIRTNFMRYVFEPLSTATFDMVDTQGKDYLNTLYKQGAFDDGGTGDPNEAYFFECNNSNNTDATKAAKTLVVDWGIRPVGVAEIVKTQSTIYAGIV